MTRTAVALSLLTLAASVWSADPPRVLIVQQREAVKEGVDLNVYTGEYLASEIQHSGLLNPIVWGMGDPIFRTAALEGKVTRISDTPSINEALSAASQLKADYTIWLRSVREKGRVTGLLRLYKGRREIFKDEKTLAVGINSEASDIDTGRSLARTWMMMLSTKPLKDLKPVLRVDTPPLAQGQQPPVIQPPVVAPPVVPPSGDAGTPVKSPVLNESLKQEIDALVAAQRVQEAVIRLRDAVDQEPLDLERRSLLIETLMRSDAAAAAAEARRAAVLFPDKPDLRILAARGWLLAGKPEEARQDLNEAVVRDPSAVGTRLLLAEISLGENKPESALEHVDAVIRAAPTADAHHYRALCRALLGGKEGVEADYAQSRSLEPAPSPSSIRRRHDFAFGVLEKSFRKAVDDQRSLLQRAMVRPKDAAVSNELDRLMRQNAARTAFLEHLDVPVDGRASYERRLLGSRLLGQSLLDLQAFLKNGSEETLAESRINLGEAARHLTESTR